MLACKVLLVEPDPPRRAALRQFLGASTGVKYSLFEADTVQALKLLLENETIDGVLLGATLSSAERNEILGHLDAVQSQRPIAALTILSQEDDHSSNGPASSIAVDRIQEADLSTTLIDHAIVSALEREALRRTVDEQSQQLHWLHALERERRAQLDQRTQERDTFLAMLSHELRNPLGAIAMAAELIQQDADPQQQSLGLRVILRQSQHMSRMLDELLDVARITQGKIELKKQPVAVATLVDHAIQSTQSLANAARHRLIVSPIDPAWMVHGDNTRLEQVLVNLLKNAIKFTPPGGLIEVAARDEEPDIGISVRDNGSGIPVTMLNAIFEPFVQTERTADRSQGGLGLGLAVVRKLVELHDGKVRVESDGIGQGSVFTICLPAAHKLNQTTEEAAAARGPHRDVLVVEDSPDAREMMSRLLRLLGHHVSVAEDGQRGLDALRARSYDVALVDIGLPVMDGYQLARQFRSLPDARPVKLIAITGYGNPEDRRQALEAGFDEHIVKPVNLARLAELIDSGRLSGV